MQLQQRGVAGDRERAVEAHELVEAVDGRERRVVTEHDVAAERAQVAEADEALERGLGLARYGATPLLIHPKALACPLSLPTQQNGRV